MNPPPAGFRESTTEFWQWLVRCIEDNGQVARIGDSEPPFVEAISPGASSVGNHCLEVAKEEEWFVPSPFDNSDDGNRLMFEVYLVIHDCLKEHGYPTADPPSAEAFVDEPFRLWNPYAGFPSGGSVSGHPDVLTDAEKFQMEAQRTCGASVDEVYAAKVDADG